MASYINGTFIWVQHHAVTANQVATQLGVSPTAILGSIANEYNSRITSPALSVLGEPFQTAADIFATLHAHSFLYANYQALVGYSDEQLAALSKIQNPILIDVGPGNIRILQPSI